MLTKKQKQLLNFISTFQSRNGVTPSYEEMKDALALKSKSGIHRLILALEERGFVKRLAHKARALEIIKDGITNLDVSSHRKNVVIADFKEQSHNLSENKVSTIPMLGKIAAGTPIEAIQHGDDMIDVPRELMSVGESYALKVEGDSMINEGIHEGDTVIIKRSDTADNGKIVVALIDEHEAMLKRIRRKGKTVALESANRNYETKIFGPDRVKVQGVLVSLYRNF